jgi:hypothetical protein
MMEIMTRNGFIYNANDLVHSQIREQIILAALQVERKALYRATNSDQNRVLCGSWLWGGLQTNFYVARAQFTACNWKEKILNSMEIRSITT